MAIRGTKPPDKEPAGSAGSDTAGATSTVATGSSAGGERTDATAPYEILRTRPSILSRHDISDEELGVLGDMKRDYLWEGMWVALGAVLGAAPGAIAALFLSYTGENPTPLSMGDLVQVLILFVGLVLFLALWRIMNKKHRDARDLVQAIRDRTQSRVTG